MPESFAHFGVRSAYSLGQSLAMPDELARRAAHLDQPALAIADTMSLAAAPEFAETARRVGLKPIAALEVRVRRHAPLSPLPRKNFAVRLAALDAQGWRRLVRLCALGAATADRALGWEDLVREPSGLVLLAGGLDSELAEEENPELARDAKALMELLLGALQPDQLLFALPNPASPRGARQCRILARIAAKCGIACAAVPDIDLLHPEDALALTAFQRARAEARADPPPLTLRDLRDWSDPAPRHLLHARQVREAYKDFPVAFENAGLLAERCAAIPERPERRFPVDEFRRGEDADSFLWNRCFELAVQTYGEQAVPWRERLNRELAAIDEAGLSDALLCAARLNDALESRGILRSPGAGIFSNSLAASLLGLTRIDPLKFDLPFELPAGAARRTPVIELGVARRSRDEAEAALRELYGANARPVGAWTAWSAAAALECACEAAGLPPRRASAIAKTASWSRALETAALAPSGNFPDQSLPVADERSLAWIAHRIAGRPKALRAEPGEFAISARPIDESIPGEGAGEPPASAWDGEGIRRMGFGRIAFAADPMLDVAASAVEWLHWEGPNGFDPLRLDAADPRVADLMHAGDTTGIALLERPSIRRLLRSANPPDLLALSRLLAQRAASRGEREHGFREVALAFQCAAIKANAPEAFHAAVLCERASDTGAVAALVQEARNLGIAILPLDINLSTWGWTPGKRTLRPGFCCLPGLPRAAADEIEQARREMDFQDLASILRRCRPQALKAQHIELLIRAGALDDFSESREGLLAELRRLDPLLRPRSGAPDARSLELFGSQDEWWIEQVNGSAEPVPPPESDAERRAMEIAACGLSFIHPESAEWAACRRGARALEPWRLIPRNAGRPTALWGVVSDCEAADGETRVLAEMEGVAIDAPVSSLHVLRRCRDSGEPLLAAGLLERDGIHWTLRASWLACASAAASRAVHARGIEIDAAHLDDAALKALLQALKAWPGETPVRLRGAKSPSRLAAKIESRRVLLAPLLELRIGEIAGAGRWRAFVDGSAEAAKPDPESSPSEPAALQA